MCWLAGPTGRRRLIELACGCAEVVRPRCPCVGRSPEASRPATRPGTEDCRPSTVTIDARRRASDYRGPTLLLSEHGTGGFTCTDEALDDWFKRRAPRNQRAGWSRTWVVTDSTRVVAYYASGVAAITRTDATRRATRSQPDPLPVMLLGRLVVDRRHQGRGLAAALLKNFDSRSSGSTHTPESASPRCTPTTTPPPASTSSTDSNPPRSTTSRSCSSSTTPPPERPGGRALQRQIRVR